MTSAHILRHHHGKRDDRYSIAREYCGYRKPTWVVRICGDWNGCTARREDALIMARAHQARRNQSLGLSSTPSFPERNSPCPQA